MCLALGAALRGGTSSIRLAVSALIRRLSGWIGSMAGSPWRRGSPMGTERGWIGGAAAVGGMAHAWLGQNWGSALRELPRRR